MPVTHKIKIEFEVDASRLEPLDASETEPSSDYQFGVVEALAKIVANRLGKKANELANDTDLEVFSFSHEVEGV